ncbi:MAG: hypothetical protein ACOX2G_02635 [Bacillota bacterium]
MRKRNFKVIKGGRTRRSKVWLRLFAMGMVVLAGFLVWNSLGHLSLLAAKVTVARHTPVKTGMPVSCVVLCNEWVVNAPIGGEYIPLVEDGTRVKAGQVFARIEGAEESRELVAPGAGLVRHGGEYRADLPLDVLNQGTAIIATALLKAPPGTGHAAKVKAGLPAAVILDNTRFQLITGMRFHSPGKKQTLVATVDGRELKFAISPREVLQYENLFWVLWDAPALPDSLGLQRVFSGEMIAAEQELVLIPQGALYKKEGQQGVFILLRRKPVFCPVEVHYSEEDVVGVSGLSDGVQVLSLPKWVSFAKRWWE